jgi:DNA polymerase III epsilon subunit-like protein
MQHWNGDQMCAIDIETTGLDPSWHEIIQIAIVPLDSNIRPRKDILPFYIQIKPESPERADREAMNVNRMDFAHLAQVGHDPEKAKDLLRDWTEKLKLPYSKYGAQRKRIIPLGQNYSFDMGFIKKWLGIPMYEEFFSHMFRDTMTVAAYLNDRAACHAEDVPFAKQNLRFLAKRLNVTYEEGRAHDALQDCLVAAEVYRQMINRGLLG